VVAYDPEGMHEAKHMLPGVELAPDAYAAMTGADCLVIVTEWNQFRSLQLDRVRKLLKSPIVVDLRNVYSPADMKAAGFVYHSVGRPAAATGSGAEE